MSVQDINPHLFVLTRFAAAALLMLPWAIPDIRDRYARNVGLTLGALDGALCAILALNIGHMPASRCAFIMGSSVVLVPFIAAAAGRYRLRLMDLARTAVSFVGLYILTGAELSHLGRHDAWIFCAAVLWASTVVILKETTSRRSCSPKTLTFFQALSTCVVPAVLLWREPSPSQFTWPASLGLAYCALFATVLTLALQTRFQKHVSASQAGLRLAMEPLFASLFACVIFGEALTIGVTVGGALMVAATVLPDLWDAALRMNARRAGREALAQRATPAAARRSSASVLASRRQVGARP